MYNSNMTHLIQKFGKFLLVSVNDAKEAMCLFSTETLDVKEIKNISSYLKKLSGKYLLLIEAEKKINCNELSLRRLLHAAENRRAGIIYSDFIRQEGNNLFEHPLIDYQKGSIRDDFKFGHLLIFPCEAVKSVLQKYGSLPFEDNAALYDLRLKISTDYELIHVLEFLYTIVAKTQKKIKASGRKTEAHFAYVAKENILRQKKMEKIATNHLKRIGAYVPPLVKKVEQQQSDLQWKASIVIPVLNRRKTIADALGSALEQKTDFPFNVIVVDNHSTDGTTDILKKVCRQASPCSSCYSRKARSRHRRLLE